MMSQSEFTAAFRDEIGVDLGRTVQDPEVMRWINRGQARLGVYRPMTYPLSWEAGAAVLSLPADFYKVEEIVSSDPVPSYSTWGGSLQFDDPAPTDGFAVLRYYAYWPKITGKSQSQLPDVGDDAVLSYALYRFFKRMASSRADYRTFATMTAQNGVDLSELDALSERHYNDFEDARDGLVDEQPSYFYGG